MRESATTMPFESTTVTKSAIMAESAVTASKVVSVMTPSSAMTRSIMIPSVTPTVPTVVWMAIAVAVGRISTAVTVATGIAYVVATLSRNQTKEE